MNKTNKITCWSAGALLALTLAVLAAHPALAATITVTNGNDAGAGSLRQAIADAQPGDTIVFDGDHAIALSSTLVISKHLTIDGGEHAITVSGDDAVRVFEVAEDAHVTFAYLTITHGKDTDDNGGGGLKIWPGAAVTLTHSAVLSNTTTDEDGKGGGIYNRGGRVTVQNSTISGNTAPNGGEGGAIYSGGAYSGSVIYDGVMRVQHSTLSDNTAPCGGGGIANGWHGTMTVSDSTVSDNVSPGDSCEGSGGGISNRHGTLTVTHSTIAGNAYEAYGGGGLGNYEGTLTVMDSTIRGNTAGGYGGGIHNEYKATLTVQNCAIYSNTADGRGGGISSYDYAHGGPLASLMLTNSALFGNAAESGGGLANDTGPLTVTNSTLYSNTATGTGPGEGYGGGLYNEDSAPTLVNSILWDNAASIADPQIHNATAVTPTISYCDIEGSGGSASWDSTLGADGGHNIDADPLFVDGPGGDLHVQLASPAIDAGNNLSIALTTDLAGNPRFWDVPSAPDTGSGIPPIVDLGAYEAGPIPTLHKSVAPAEAVAYHGPVTYTLRLSNAGVLSDTVLLTDTLPTGVAFGGWVISPTGTLRSGNAITWTGAISAGEGITLAFTALHTGDYGEAITNTATISGTAQRSRDEAAFTVVANQAPVGDAGPDQTVMQGDLVQLDGSASSDPDGAPFGNGDSLTYGWTQTGGSPPMALSDNTVVSPTFTADHAGVFTFTLVVTDSVGLVDPTPDEVVITVEKHCIYLPLVVRHG